MEKKDKFYISMVLCMILLILFLAWRIGGLKNNNSEDIEALRKSIIESDSLKKERDGQYAKLVDYYNSEKDLKEQLKNSNKELYKTIKKQDERILSLTSAVISLEGAVNSGFGSFNPTDSNLIDLKLKYPVDDENPFIKWNGSINKNTAFYDGKWDFGRLPIQIILTEEKRGLWNTRMVGPTWLKVDSLLVNSLPAESYTEKKERNIQFLVGGLYNSSIVPMTPRAIGIGGGISFKGKHNFILNVNTNQTFNIQYYYKFKTFKKNK